MAFCMTPSDLGKYEIRMVTKAMGMGHPVHSVK
jgi:hypothetical protein